MTLSRLALTDVRNHADALLEVQAGFVLLSGSNGAGKTNILEAISLLAPGRGMRRAPLSDIARQGGAGGFSIAARLGNAIEIGTGTLPASPERRQVRINGAAASVNALSERLAVLWLTPAMDRLFGDSAGARRRFLDRLVLALEPGHAHHASRYEAAMRARNKLLSDPDHADPTWLEALEIGMAEHGMQVAEARDRTVQALNEALDAQPQADFPRARLTLEGCDGATITEALRRNRGRDATAGRATVGPHRHDVAVTHVEKGQSAALGSTGEQKALLIGIVLAHADLVNARRGAPPILLLDEVAAHLDPYRRAALFDRLTSSGQVWMTATEDSLFEGIGKANRFHVIDGAVASA
jgi:DNA replication and repair protein RecF